MTVREAASQLRVPLETIVKSILSVDEEQMPVLAILTGGKRVDRKKLSSVVGVSKIKITTPEVTKMLTGFEVGTMPPLGHEKRLMTEIDEKVVNFGKVYEGSGVEKVLMEIAPQDIVRLAAGKVAGISE